MPAYDYHRPTSLAEALKLKTDLPAARYIAGGTDVMVRVRESRGRLPALISLTSIPEMTGIELGDTIRVGALTKVNALTEDEGLASSLPALVRAAGGLGSIQIRNLATIAGNLCNASPCADLAPPLLTLDARLRIVGAEGAREVSLSDFFVAPGETRLANEEIVTHVLIDRPPAGSRATFVKKGRVAMDIAIANLAVLLVTSGGKCSEARVAAGSLAPTPVRLKKTEAALSGRELTDEVLARAGETAHAEVSPISDVRAGAEYRRALASALLKRAVRALREEAGA